MIALDKYRNGQRGSSQYSIHNVRLHPESVRVLHLSRVPRPPVARVRPPAARALRAVVGNSASASASARKRGPAFPACAPAQCKFASGVSPRLRDALTPSHPIRAEHVTRMAWRGTVHGDGAQ